MNRRVDFAPSPRHFPFTSRWFESHVGRVHYVDEGWGRPILLVHGNLTWSFLYRHVIGALRGAGFRCLALDLPGHGLSDHPDGYGYGAAEHARVVRAFVRHLDLRDLLVLGQDWGGPIGVWAATEERERVAGVVLGNTFVGPIDGLRLHVFARVMRSRWMQRAILDRDGFVGGIIRSSLRSPISPAEMDHYRAVFPGREFRRGIATLPKQLLDASGWLQVLASQARDRLGGRPALVFSGRKDPLLGTPARARRLQDVFPSSTVIPLPDAGHYFVEDAPAVVAAAIGAWAGGLPRPAAIHFSHDLA